MKKQFLVNAALLLSLSAAFPSMAGVWKQGEGTNAGRWWYDNEDGTWASSGWKWIDGNSDGTAECYYFDAAGWLLTGTVTPDLCTVDANGAWVVDGVVQTQAVSGWQQSGGVWRYFVNGRALTSQWRKISGERYYFDENGVMATGFLEIDGDDYYFTASGALRTRDFVLDGVRYTVESDGVISDEEDTDAHDTFRSTSSNQSSSDGSSSGGSSASSEDKSDDSPSGPAAEANPDGGGDEKPVYEYPKESPDSSWRREG